LSQHYSHPRSVGHDQKKKRRGETLRRSLASFCGFASPDEALFKFAILITRLAPGNVSWGGGRLHTACCMPHNFGIQKLNICLCGITTSVDLSRAAKGQNIFSRMEMILSFLPRDTGHTLIRRHDVEVDPTLIKNHPTSTLVSAPGTERLKIKPSGRRLGPLARA